MFKILHYLFVLPAVAISYIMLGASKLPSLFIRMTIAKYNHVSLNNPTEEGISGPLYVGQGPQHVGTLSSEEQIKINIKNGDK